MKQIFVIAILSLFFPLAQPVAADEIKDVYCTSEPAIYAIAKAYAVGGREKAKLTFTKINELLGKVCFNESLKVQGNSEDYFITVVEKKNVAYGYAPVVLNNGKQVYLLMALIRVGVQIDS